MSGEELKLNEVEAGKLWSEPVSAEAPEMDTLIATECSSGPVMLTHTLPLLPSFTNTSVWPNITTVTVHGMHGESYKGMRPTCIHIYMYVYTT